MKNYFLMLATLSITYSLIAQDTIRKRSGDVIVAKISELTPTEIKYKRFDLQEGPMYVELKSNIESVNYSNGVKEAFKDEFTKPSLSAQEYYLVKASQYNKISMSGGKYLHKDLTFSEKEIQNFLLTTNNKEIVDNVKKARKAKRMQFIGFAGIPLGVAGLFAFSSATTYNSVGKKQTDEGLIALSGLLFAAAIACPISAGICKSKRNKYNRTAIDQYNESY